MSTISSLQRDHAAPLAQAQRGGRSSMRRAVWTASVVLALTAVAGFHWAGLSWWLGVAGVMPLAVLIVLSGGLDRPADAGGGAWEPPPPADSR